MTWVKDANKKYKHYEETRKGFRIYNTKFRQTHIYIEDRPDGRWRVTDFIPGRWTAIDKNWLTFSRPTLTELWWDIDIYRAVGYVASSSNQQYMKENEELKDQPAELKHGRPLAETKGHLAEKDNSPDPRGLANPPRPLTLGEKRIRTTFNVSGSSLVDEIKGKSADLINLTDSMGDGVIHSMAPLPEGTKMAASGEKRRLIELAKTAYEQAAMWAVKAATMD